MNSLVITAALSVAVLFMGLVSYRVYYTTQTVALIQQRKQNYYALQALVGWGVGYYKKRGALSNGPITRELHLTLGGHKIPAKVTLTPTHKSYITIAAALTTHAGHTASGVYLIAIETVNQQHYYRLSSAHFQAGSGVVY